MAFTYDPVGNRLTKVDSGATTSYAYDAANQLLTEDDGTTVTTYAYDNSGNNTVQDAGGAVTTYAWDGENRLATIALSGGAVQTMTYDATGLRRKKQTAAGVTRFVWDGRDVLLETNGNGATQARYTLTPDDLGLLVAPADRPGSASQWPARARAWSLPPGTVLVGADRPGPRWHGAQLRPGRAANLRGGARL